METNDPCMMELKTAATCICPSFYDIGFGHPEEMNAPLPGRHRETGLFRSRRLRQRIDHINPFNPHRVFDPSHPPETNMRLIHLVPLLPLALAAPTKVSIPELSPSEWGLTLSGFVDDFRSLSSWSWAKAEQVVEANTAPDSSLTIYQQLKADPNSFSKLVKVLEVSDAFR